MNSEHKAAELLAVLENESSRNRNKTITGKQFVFVHGVEINAVAPWSTQGGSSAWSHAAATAPSSDLPDVANPLN
jgi:hypothetical protein